MPGAIAEIGPVRDVVQNPLHPYAKGLMGAIPTLAGEDERLVQIPGSMPRLVGDPAGLRVQSALRLRVRPLPRRAAGADPARRTRGRLPSLRQPRHAKPRRRPRHERARFVDVRELAPRLRRLEAVAQPRARGRPSASF